MKIGDLYYIQPPLHNGELVTVELYSERDLNAFIAVPIRSFVIIMGMPRVKFWDASSKHVPVLSCTLGVVVLACISDLVGVST